MSNDSSSVNTNDALFGVPVSKRELKKLVPVLAEERATGHESGLWTSKAHGTLKEGDNRNSPVYVQGTVELLQLRELFKLTFKNCKLVWRV